MHDLRPLDSSVGPFPLAIGVSKKAGNAIAARVRDRASSRGALAFATSRWAFPRSRDAACEASSGRRKRGDGSGRGAGRALMGSEGIGCADPLRSAG